MTQSHHQISYTQMPKLTYIDLFSGAGGLSLGLKHAGWSPLLSVEIDKSAGETYRKNFPNTDLYIDDINNLSLKKYKGTVDLVAGGPPCQPFSVAGSQNACKDPRDMIPQFIRAVSEVKPNAFLMENVAGLTTKRHSVYLNKAITALEELGYMVKAKVLNAADYGAPQDRFRLIVVGTKTEGFQFPRASYGVNARYEYVSAGDALNNTPEDEPNKAIVTFAKNPVLRPSPWAGMLVNGGGRPINLQQPSQTIPASAGGNRTHILDRDGVLLDYHRYLSSGGKPKSGLVEGVRRLTVRESARLQSFPDEFVFLGTRSAQYRQVGNAVPPKLSKSLGNKIKKMFA